VGQILVKITTVKNNFFSKMLFFVLSSTCNLIVSSQEKREVTGRTILHKACIGYTKKEVRQLILSRVITGKNNGEDSSTKSIICGQISLVKIVLLSNSNQINIQDSDGNTPLHLLCINDAKIDIVNRLLVEPGIDVNLHNKNGNTPLHLACDGGCRVNVVKALLAQQGIDTEKKNIDGYTAYDLAVRSPEGKDVALLFKKDNKPDIVLVKSDVVLVDMKKMINFLFIMISTLLVLHYAGH